MKNSSVTSQKIEEKLKEKGVAKYAYTVTMRRMEEFTAKNSAFSLLRTTFNSSLSLSVFIDGRKGTKVSSALSDEEIAQSIDDAIASSASAESDSAYDIAASIGTIENLKEDDDDNSLFFSRINELLDNIRENYPSLLVMDTVGQHIHYDTVYHNSNGTDYHTTGGFYEVYIGFSSHDGDKTSGMNYSGFTTSSLDKPFIEMGSISDDLISQSKSLETASCGGKFTGTLIFKPSCLSSFLYFLSKEISDLPIMQKISPWKDKIGEKVADERITLALESSNPDIVNGEYITDDGFKTEDVTLIENGVLKSFLLSLYAANKTKCSVTKNSSSDVVMNAGDMSLDEMIKNTKRGLIVGGFSGGHPSISGDFSGVAKNSFYIEDGEIKGAVNETMINGNLLEMLNNVEGISEERVKDGSSVLPYLAVGGVVISGK